MRHLFVFSFILSFSFGVVSVPSVSAEPINGKIWSSAANDFVTEAQLIEAISEVELVLLGETHDNPIHHAIQSRLFDALAEDGRRPALVWEMVERSQQHLLTKPGMTAETMGEILRWETRGWPNFNLYRPIAETAFDNDLPQLAGNIDRQTVRGMISTGQLAIPRTLRRMMNLPTLDEMAAEPLVQEIVAAHCDMLPAHAAKPMVDIQRARDASLALALQAGAELSGDGAVLIAGSMHVRNSIAVPAHLDRLGNTLSMVSIAPWEVAADATNVPDTSEFDYVWFTDAAEREDPCERFARHMENKNKGQQTP